MIVGVILAAGESRRMGRPKQLLPWGETIVLQRVIDATAASCLEQVILVLGANADEIAGRIRLPDKGLSVINQAYREGMAASVKCGILSAPAQAEAFMIILGDQPLLEGAVIDTLVHAHRAGGWGITIPIYQGRRGHPVIFSGRYRQELLAIGAEGAREVVRRHRDETGEVAVGTAHILLDLDTPEDYRRVMGEKEAP